MLVHLSKGVVTWSSSNIELLDIDWVKIFCNTLEKPFVTIDLSIVVVLQSEHEVDLSASEVVVILDSEIFSDCSESMEQVLWIVFKSWFHNILNGLHFILSSLFVISCETLLFEQIQIENSNLGEVVNEALWDLFDTITAENNNKVVLLKLDMWVLAQNLDVLHDTSHCILEFVFVFIIHGDINHVLGLSAMVMMESL